MNAPLKKPNRTYQQDRSQSHNERSNAAAFHSYFDNLNGKRPKLKTLQSYWQQLPHIRPSSEAVRNMLFHLSKSIRSTDPKPPDRAILNYLRKDMDAWNRHAAEHLKTASAQDLEKIASARNAINIAPGDDLRRNLQKRYVDIAANKPETIRPANNMNLMVALGIMGTQLSRTFSSSLAGSVETDLDQYSDSEKITCLWACALIHVNRPDKIMPRIAQAILKRGPIEPDTIALQQQFADAARWFDYAGDIAIPDELETFSGCECRLRSAFESAGVTMLDDTECYIVPLEHKIDMGIEWKGHKIFIEYDGPSHFVYPENTDDVAYNGQTKLQSGLIAKTMPDITLIRMRYTDMNTLAQRNKKRLHSGMRCLLDQAVQLGPGAYETHMENGKIALADHIDTRFIRSNAHRREEPGFPIVEAGRDAGRGARPNL